MNSKTSYTLEQIAKITDSQLVGDPTYCITGVENLECAQSEDISFLANPLYLKQLKRSKAGAVFITQPPQQPSDIHFLIHPNPSKAFQKLIEMFYNLHQADSGFEGVHPSAIIHPTAQIDSSVQIGPGTVIDRDVEISAGTQILSNVTIGPEVKIQSNCLIHSNVVIREACIIKEHVILQPGCVIGSCGFGYITDQKGQHKKLQHVGKVVLESNVEIGANTTIDRARFKDTLIASGVKIDNQVQIGHGVQVGENSIIISQAGIAGSSKLGKYNVIAGQVGIVGHIEMGDHITIAARGAVTKNLKHPGRYGGAPALPEDRFYTQQMHFRKLDIYVSKIRELEKKLARLEKEHELSKV